MLKLTPKHIAVAVLATMAFSAAANAQEFERCSITPIAQVGYIDTFTTPEECVAACTETEGCDSWSFRPHSFDPSSPGSCKLIDGIFKKEESERGFCGEM